MQRQLIYEDSIPMGLFQSRLNPDSPAGVLDLAPVKASINVIGPDNNAANMPELDTLGLKSGEMFVPVRPKDLASGVSLRELRQDAALNAARNNATFPIFSDQYETATRKAYPVYNVPTHIFIDPNRIVRHVVLSEMTVDDAIGKCPRYREVRVEPI